MTAQPATIGHQWTQASSDRMEDTINKLNELGSGTGVGANFYPGAADDLKVRFGDHKHGIEYVTLAPHEVAAVRAYMDRHDKPENAKVRKLFADADKALVSAQEYVREYYAKNAGKMATKAAQHMRAA